MLRAVLAGPPGNPQAFGAMVRLKYAAGKFGPAREIHGGGGYWSQDSATPLLGGITPVAVWVRWPGGATTETPVPTGAESVALRQGGSD